jgi:hypothetical protein
MVRQAFDRLTLGGADLPEEFGACSDRMLGAYYRGVG